MLSIHEVCEISLTVSMAVGVAAFLYSIMCHDMD